MIDTFRLFILTAKYLSITQAARESRISQSTASRRLIQFESDIGIRLFKKKGRRIELTQLGQGYFKDVSPIFSDLEAVQKRYGGTEGLSIAASHRPSKYFLPPLISEFCQTHPKATINLHTHSSVAIEKLLLDGKVDFAITTNPPVSASSSFVIEPYCREPLMAFAAANHPFARMKSWQPAAMGTVPVILNLRREGESRIEAELRKFAKQGMKFKVVVRCDSPEVVKEFVRYGAGVGFLYLNSIKRGIERGYFKTIQFPGLDLTGQDCIVYSKERQLSPLAREFLAFLRASLTKAVRTKIVTAQNSKRRSGRLTDYVSRPRLLTWIISITSLDWMSWVVA